MRREVLALARALSQDLLQRMPERVVDAVALEQINTAIDAACTILRMAVAWDEQGLGLTPQEAGQVACGLGPVFLGGKSVLAALTIRALPTAAPPGSTAEAQACLHSLASIVRNELAAADDVLRLLVIAGQPAGMQLFADTVVVDTVLKWITAVSQALAVLLAAPPPQGARARTAGGYTSGAAFTRATGDDACLCPPCPPPGAPQAGTTACDPLLRLWAGMRPCCPTC